MRPSLCWVLRRCAPWEIGLRKELDSRGPEGRAKRLDTSKQRTISNLSFCTPCALHFISLRSFVEPANISFVVQHSNISHPQLVVTLPFDFSWLPPSNCLLTSCLETLCAVLFTIRLTGGKNFYPPTPRASPSRPASPGSSMV